MVGWHGKQSQQFAICREASDSVQSSRACSKSTVPLAPSPPALGLARHPNVSALGLLRSTVPHEARNTISVNLSYVRFSQSNLATTQLLYAHPALSTSSAVEADVLSQARAPKSFVSSNSSSSGVCNLLLNVIFPLLVAFGYSVCNVEVDDGHAWLEERS